MKNKTAASRRTVLTLIAILVMEVPGCHSAPLLERVKDKRGVGSHAIATRCLTEAYLGVPGTWESTRFFLPPMYFAWQILTAADPLFQLFDGRTARSLIGTAETSRDSSPGTPLRSIARWIAVANLQGLDAPGVIVRPLRSDELDDGASAGLAAEFPDGALYRLAFDDRLLLTALSGPLDLTPFAKGEVTARFSEHRELRGVWIPFKASYSMYGTTIAQERVLTACIDPIGLTAESFVDPTKLPECS